MLRHADHGMLIIDTSRPLRRERPKKLFLFAATNAAAGIWVRD